MTALLPDGARSMVVVPDTHIGKNLPGRYFKVRQALNRDTPMFPVPAVVAHIGDLIEGGSNVVGADIQGWVNQEAVSVPWWAGFARYGLHKVRHPGNHDLARDPAWSDDQATSDWEAVNGESAGGVFDTPYFRYVTLRGNGGNGPLTSAAEQAAFEAAVAATSKPVVLGIHYRYPTAEFGVGSTTVGSSTWSAIKAIRGRNANLKAVVHGHTHEPWSRALYSARLEPCDLGTQIVSVNSGAITYVWSGDANMGDPLVVPVLSFLDDGSVQVRWRELGAGVWVARPGKPRVETFVP